VVNVGGDTRTPDDPAAATADYGFMHCNWFIGSCAGRFLIKLGPGIAGKCDDGPGHHP